MNEETESVKLIFSITDTFQLSLLDVQFVVQILNKDGALVAQSFTDLEPHLETLVSFDAQAIMQSIEDGQECTLSVLLFHEDAYVPLGPLKDMVKFYYSSLSLSEYSPKYSFTQKKINVFTLTLSQSTSLVDDVETSFYCLLMDEKLNLKVPI